jgi:hypothetical protein
MGENTYYLRFAVEIQWQDDNENEQKANNQPSESGLSCLFLVQGR